MLAIGEVVEPVNFNAPLQVVIAGHKAAVERACQAAKELGAKRAMPLPVSAPFHSSLLRPAGERLAQALAQIPIRPPAVALVNNVDVAVESDPDRIRALEPPAPAFDRQLGDDPLNASVGSLPALLADLPAAAITWFEELAEATQLVGLRIAPRMPGWLTLLQPIGSGQVAHALHRAPRGVGLFSVQRFAFADARRAEAALGLLEPLLPAPGAVWTVV